MSLSAGERVNLPAASTAKFLLFQDLGGVFDNLGDLGLAEFTGQNRMIHDHFGSAVDQHGNAGIRVDAVILRPRAKLYGYDDRDVLEGLAEFRGAFLQVVAIFADEVHDRCHLLVGVLGYDTVNLLDQTGQGVALLFREDQDDGTFAKLSHVTELLADLDLVIRRPALLDDKKRGNASADLLAALEFRSVKRRRAQ